MKPLSQTRSALPGKPSHDRLRPDLIDLSDDYSHYTVPRPVAEAVVHAATSTDLGRDLATGERHLRQRIVRKLAEFNDLEVTGEHVVVTSGGTAAFSHAFAALADPGDAFLLPDPGSPLYTRLCLSYGFVPVPYPLLTDGTPDYPALPELIRPETKALVISTPSNPGGAVLDAEQCRTLVEFARAHDLYLVSDEMSDLIRFLPGPASGPAKFDTDGRVITVFSFAKTHALAGLRLGYAVASPLLAEAIQRTQAGFGLGPSTLAVAAGLPALDMDQCVVESMTEFYQQQRETAIALFGTLLPNPPNGGFHCLIDLRGTSLPDGEAFALACLERKALLLASGRRFGQRTAHCVRLTLAAREKTFGEGVARLLDLIHDLKA